MKFLFLSLLLSLSSFAANTNVNTEVFLQCFELSKNYQAQNPSLDEKLCVYIDSIKKSGKNFEIQTSSLFTHQDQSFESLVFSISPSQVRVFDDGDSNSFSFAISKSSISSEFCYEKESYEYRLAVQLDANSNTDNEKRLNLSELAYTLTVIHKVKKNFDCDITNNQSFTETSYFYSVKKH